MRKIIILLGVYCLMCSYLFSVNIDSLYNQSRYQEIINEYDMMNSRDFDATDYYNIAQAHYKLKNIGLAVLNYERALRLDPNNETIKNNLDFISSSINENKGVGLNSAIGKMVYFFDASTIYVLALVSFVIFVIFFVVFKISYKTRIKIYSFVFSIIFLIISLWFNLSIAYSIYNLKSYKDYAIITSSDAKIDVAGNTEKENNYEIKEGTKIKVIKRSSIESEVQLSEGTRGKVLNSKFSYIVE